VDQPLRPKTDDLFASSTMTFGEHLEELRKSLAKALIWLAIGLGIGLYFADRLVRFIQRPMEEAVAKFYRDRGLRELGFDPDDPAQATPEAIRAVDHLRDRQLVPREMWIVDLPDVAAVTPPAVNSLETIPAEDPSAQPDSAQHTATSDPVDDPPTPVSQEASDARARALLSQISRIDQLQKQVVLFPVDRQLTTTKTEEGFMVWMKAGLVIGAVVASPMIFWHLWQFVAAGLYPNERRYVHIYLPFSVALFAFGVGLAFFFVLKFVLNFLVGMNAQLGVDIIPRLSDYVSFVLLLPLGFGIAFQLPLVMLFLQRVGIFTTAAYIRSWRIAVLIIFVISMILTPAEPYSMLAMALPLTGLYFFGIAMCRFMPAGHGLGSQGYDPS
jgi:sec-independent protein translocase protein TatC